MKSKGLMFLALLVFNQSVHGFLLDGPSNSAKQTTGNIQFLAETDFIQAKKLLQQNIDELRRDTDKTIAFLTSQLKNKFVLLETKLSNVEKQNATNNDCVSMEKYLALEQKLTSVQKENEQMKQGNKAVKNELLSLKNKSSTQEMKIEELQKLGTIKPLQEINALQQSVHLNTDKIHSLSMNEQARSQDFLALYNITTATGRKLTEMKTSTNNLILHLENNQTMTMNNLRQTLDNQLTSFQTSYNATIYDLHTKEISMQKQITENNERVALYALASGKSGNVIQFNNVQLSVGIKNTSAFKSTGKFVCEKEGLYLVAASVASSEYSHFCINRGNTHVVSCTEIGQHSGSAWHSGTSVTILHLHVNDNISIATSNTIEAGYWTQFTLIKIK
ncbi:uncharacterized protein [Mytilus edulis]|uniref:uncharacterized protein n=1 Tax=Mytilus edulis TaxID=6550 RepID=UPI0039EF571E